MVSATMGGPAAPLVAPGVSVAVAPLLPMAPILSFRPGLWRRSRASGDGLHYATTYARSQQLSTSCSTNAMTVCVRATPFVRRPGGAWCHGALGPLNTSQCEKVTRDGRRGVSVWSLTQYR